MKFIKIDLRDVFKSVLLSVLTVALSAGTLYAATTIGSNITTDGTLLINNATSTVTNLVMVTATTTNATTTTLAVSGVSNLSTASSTGLVKVHQLQVANSGTTIAGAVFGFCTAPSVTAAATTTTMVSCAGATGVLSGDRIFVQATSSLPNAMVVQAASSTASGVIQIDIFNSGDLAGGVTTGINSFNFWAVR